MNLLTKLLSTPVLARRLFFPFSNSTALPSSLVDDYEITGFIGKGSTSRVYQGYHILSGTQVIIKLFKDTREIRKVLKEIKANQLVSGSNDVVPLFDVVRDPGCGVYGLIFKNLQGVPLVGIIGSITFSSGLKYMKNVLEALAYCHGKGVVHRDLKKSNILVTNSGAKLFDFGLAYIEGEDNFVTKRFGTKGYYTPEVMFRVPTFTRKIDIWVCGLIMAEVLCNKKTLMPYTSDQETARQIVEFSGYDPEIVPKWELRNLGRRSIRKILESAGNSDQNQVKEAAFAIERMTEINPSNRPEAVEVLQYDIFRKLEGNA